MLARVFFCIIPAVLFFTIFQIINPLIGLLFGAVVFSVGWAVTERH